MWLDIKFEGWLIITATVMGPILAVQAQKWLERGREKGRQKMWIFHTLMATRAARLTPAHIEALNSIDIVFFGVRIRGTVFRTANEKAVVDAWREYLANLARKVDEKTEAVIWAERDKLFTDLLAALAEERGFTFDRVTLADGAYYPQGHGNDEKEQRDLRRLAIQVLSGGQPVKMDLNKLPTDEEAAERVKAIQKALVAAFEEGKLKVEIQTAPSLPGAKRRDPQG